MTQYEVSDMKGEALMERLADSLDTSTYLKVSTQVDRLHDNLVYTLGDVEAEKLIDTLHNKQPEANAEGLGDTV